MEPCERESGQPNKLRPIVADPIRPKPVSQRLSASQRQHLELLYRQCPRPTSALLQQLIKDSPILSNLDSHLLRAWFQSRRFKEKRDGKLSPLINKNAELKAEHETLLLLNNRLRSEALLLNLENQRLKKQLETQTQLKRVANSSEVAPHEAKEECCSSDIVVDDASGASCEVSKTALACVLLLCTDNHGSFLVPHVGGGVLYFP